VPQPKFLSRDEKARQWNATLALFEDAYKMPLLPPGVGAYTLL
jgi:hypothetical protein